MSETEIPEMPEDTVLGIVIYENGMAVIQAGPGVTRQIAGAMLRDLAEAIEHGHPLFSNGSVN